MAPGSVWRREVRKEVAGRERHRGRSAEVGPTHDGGVADDRGTDHGGRTWLI